MRPPFISLSLLLPPLLLGVGASVADDPARAAAGLEEAIHLQPDLGKGREVYLLCAVCHQPRQRLSSKAPQWHAWKYRKG